MHNSNEDINLFTPIYKISTAHSRWASSYLNRSQFSNAALRIDPVQS